VTGAEAVRALPRVLTGPARAIAAQIRCEACGTHVVLPAPLAAGWMDAHRMPRILAVLVQARGVSRWWEVSR
jgi:hypothetical protein